MPTFGHIPRPDGDSLENQRARLHAAGEVWRDTKPIPRRGLRGGCYSSAVVRVERTRVRSISRPRRGIQT